jgi:3',5'-cyclic-AMP phosphodiesterase
MKILHLTDLHFRLQYERADKGYLSALALMTSPLIHLEKCFSQVDRSTLDAVVISGDLCEAGSPEDYRALKKFLDKWIGNLPLIVTLGNHDNKNAFRAGWDINKGGIRDDSPYNSMLDVNGVKILSFDNAIVGFPDGAVTTEQYHWLRDALDNVSGHQVVLILHHHLKSNQADIPAAFWRADFSDLIKQSGIMGILCGHTHYSYMGNFYGVPYTTAPSMSFRAKKVSENILQFEEYPGYQICHFNDEGLSVETVSLYPEPRFLRMIPLNELMHIRQ